MKAIFTLCLLFSISTISTAQEHPKSEFYVGYSLLRTDSDSVDLVLNNQLGAVRRNGQRLGGGSDTQHHLRFSTGFAFRNP